MAKQTSGASADYIVPLYMNGLHGRMLKLPAPPKKTREILLVYGHHASIERMQGLSEYLNRFGSVTMPDLPGFGGMETFYKIGDKPTLDNLADYLASVVKLRYKQKRFTLIAMSYGFVVATRMLQKYPEIAKKVDLLVSIVGFVSHEDFHIKRSMNTGLKVLSSLCSLKWPAWFFRYAILNKPTIRMFYNVGGGRKSHPKFKNMSQEEYEQMVNFEITLWHCNDVRTYMHTLHNMLTLRLPSKHIDLPVHHVVSSVDRYFDNVKVEQHMRTIFKDYILQVTTMQNHAPTVVADAEEASTFIPSSLQKLLKKQPR